MLRARVGGAVIVTRLTQMLGEHVQIYATWQHNLLEN